MAAFLNAIMTVVIGQAGAGIPRAFAPNDVAAPPIQPSVNVSSISNQASLRMVEFEQALVDLVNGVAPSAVTIEASRMPTQFARDNRAQSGMWMSAGSGICIRSDNSILTSQHTVDDATVIHVITSDGERHVARLIAADRRSDFAILRVDGATLPVAAIGDADALSRGAFVMTLGNALGLADDGHAILSHGIVSGLRRPLPDALGYDEDRYFGEMLVTNMAAAAGSSGGPVFNARGELVGIMTAVFSRGGEGPAYSFATPLNRRNRDIVQQLLAGQVVEYGYLGVEVEPISDRLRTSLGLHRRVGIRLASVFENGPAALAGMQTGDIVIGVNGHTVSSVDQFIRLVGAGGVGQRVQLMLRRGDAVRRFTATLERRPDLVATGLPEEEISLRGATLGPLTPALRSSANLPENSLLVIRVEARSPAADANLVPGDVVVRIDGLPIDQRIAERAVGVNGDLMLGLANGGTVMLKAPNAR